MDASLTSSIDKPMLEGNKWRDVATGFVKRGNAIDGCNDRLKLIRELE